MAILLWDELHINFQLLAVTDMESSHVARCLVRAERLSAIRRIANEDPSLPASK